VKPALLEAVFHGDRSRVANGPGRPASDGDLAIRIDCCEKECGKT
jgi:hypothetical protein